MHTKLRRRVRAHCARHIVGDRRPAPRPPRALLRARGRPRRDRRRPAGERAARRRRHGRDRDPPPSRRIRGAAAREGIAAAGAARRAYLELDAERTMETRVAGLIATRRFAEPVARARVRRPAAGRPLFLYGEMVACAVRRRASSPARSQLERLWNELGAEAAFTLLCAYRAGGRDGAGAARRLRPALGDDAPLPRRPRRAARGAALRPRCPRRACARGGRRADRQRARDQRDRPCRQRLHGRAVGRRRRRPRRGRRRALRAAPAQLAVRREHGLGIVAALAAEWGADRRCDRTTVWAALRR